MITECSCECDESPPVLSYSHDDRWYVLGEETQSAAVVLGIIFGFAQAAYYDDEPS